MKPEDCQGRHDFKWNTEREAWVCLHCAVRWQDAPERQPLPLIGTTGSEEPDFKEAETKDGTIVWKRDKHGN